jgi:hypothetical protein
LSQLDEFDEDQFPFNAGDDFLSGSGGMASLDLKQPDDVIDLSLLFREPPPKSRRDLKRERKQARLQQIEESKRRWSHGAPDIMEDEYLHLFQKALARFFRSGYERYVHTPPLGDFIPDEEIVEYVNSLIKKYKFLITGGFVLKNMGLRMENSAKPSIDMDIVLPFETPILHRDFYTVMAELFDCDRKSNGKFDMQTFLARSHRDGSQSTWQKQHLYGVSKCKRNVGKDDYAEMDLVRPIRGYSPEKKVRQFDLSICMNWYDGVRINSLDKDAIMEPDRYTGWVTPREAGYLEGAERNPRTEVRVLKYLLRGYRLSYVSVNDGLVHELVTGRFPNAIRALAPNAREKYYRNHENERPSNIKRMTLKGNSLRNSQKNSLDGNNRKENK